MIDLERTLALALREEADRARFSPDAWQRIHTPRGHRPSRAFVFGFSTLVVASAILAAQVFVPRVVTPITGWVTSTDEKAGVAISYPPDWHRAGEVLTPHLGEPREVAAVGTGVMSAGGNCAQFPTASIEQLGPGDALIWIAERTDVAPSAAAEFRERPAHFVPVRAETNLDESSECLSRSVAFDHYLLRFSDRGRFFYAYVAISRSAAGDRRADTWKVLDTFTVGRPGVEPATYPDTPAAGVCEPLPGRAVTVTMNADTPLPRCARVTVAQHLRVVNHMGRVITITVGRFSRVIADGSAAEFPDPFGEYLAPGVHHVSVTSSYTAELWLAGT